ncbi:NAD(P)-dependent oxidoreductase [Alphaproteobacteria bacterium]|jgi:3-hydroxyisobutyrate dehydrogenase-like beta-hydroxyacid dehydrogenase|nr:NAD(P)-dependent oxidoreductase [Alphaproteobacteria bacterium]MDC1134470.1 NAD(P)-dependent oxidoreductase [Alphaproteobacteria bacterium]|tara:strand:- start:1738 stop:2637 length:900 start_codon:yes stop_codon:yes gene_type:complete
MENIKKVCVIGLGSMGFGIASSLIKNGHEVYGLDKDKNHTDRLQKAGGKNEELSKICKIVDVVVIVVLNSIQTEQILFGKHGIVEQLNKETLIIVCTTVSPQFAREMAEKCNQYNIHYLDAPMSGGSVKSENGQLSYMVSGSKLALQKAHLILEATAEKVFQLGEEPGKGSAMKSVNQMLAGIHISAMAEALTFGITQGIEPEKFLEVISKCAGTSWMLENRAPHIIDNDYTPKSSINIWPKDLGIVLDIAKNSNFSAPLTAIAMQQFVAAAGSGLANEDDAAVAKVYAKNAGINLPKN